MTPAGNRNGTLAAATIVGVCILAGLAAGGYFVGRGSASFKSDTHTVIVKGLVEKEIKADQAVWGLRFQSASNDLKDAHLKISHDRDVALAFLKKNGFKDEEIDKRPTQTIDKLAREYGQPQGGEKNRYIATTSLVVTTKNVDLVVKAMGATEELLESGVALGSNPEGGTANPRFIVTTFNALRPQLLAEATKNARLTGQQFASDAGAQVGKIRSANQGSIQIFGSDGNDESNYYSPTSTPMKKIRVVSTFEFELN